MTSSRSSGPGAPEPHFVDSDVSRVLVGLAHGDVGQAIVWEDVGMPPTWVASVGHLGGQYRMLMCANGAEHLHVALEGPTLEHLITDSPAGPSLPHLHVTGENWKPSGAITVGRANIAARGFNRTLILGRYPLPPDHLPQLAVTFTTPTPRNAPTDDGTLFATSFGRHHRPLPGSDLWQAHPMEVDEGYRLLGAAEGREVFYVFCEGPAAPIDADHAGEPADPLEYTLAFHDEQPEPPPDLVHPANIGPLHTARRASLLIMVARREHPPRRFTLTIRDRATGQTMLDVDARRH